MKYSFGMCISSTNYVPTTADTAAIDNRAVIKNVKRDIDLLVVVV